jgi:2-methyl-3-hydroxypyridine 5-carboxylic acid dioxygenase
MTQRHAEIAGAGFAGLVAAVALAERGWSVRVHEVSPILREFGAGIFLWENGLRVLQAIGAYDDVVRNACAARSYDDVDGHGNLICSKALPMADGTRMITMTRQNLYRPILQRAERLGVELVADSAVVGAEPRGELLLANGRRLQADLIVAADGIRSKIRRHLQLEVEHREFPIGIFRLLVPRLPHEVTDPAWQRYINFWADRRRILYVPCSDTELYVLLGARIPDPQALSQPIRAEVWSESFPPLASVFSRITGTGRFDRYEVVRCKTWSAGRVAIIGDAAHAMPPTLGQGAGTAMMNALALAERLDGAGTIDAALAEWERNERPLTDHTQSISVQRATEWQAEKPGEASWSGDVMRTALHVPTGTDATTARADSRPRA